MTEQDRQRAIREKLARMELSGAPAGVIPTNWEALDAALGNGGLPRGRIVEVYGPAGSGKTTLAMQLVARVQKDGGTAAWIDAERVFDAAYAAGLGVVTAQMPVAQPESAEQAFVMAERLAASGALDLLVVDSAAAMAPGIELETPLGESGYGLHGRVMSSGLRRLSQGLWRAGVTALFLNQTRGRGESSYAAEEGSAGGPGLKLYAAVRIALEPAGRDKVRFHIVKNKAGEPFGEGQLHWKIGSGLVEKQ